MEPVGSYLAQVAGRTLLQVLILLGPPVLLGLAMHAVAGFLESRAVLALGRVPYLVLFGWPGTLVHEAGHALFCPLFGHRITAFRPFTLDPSSRVLGYVAHEWDRHSLWARLGNFFIGTGPVVLGTLVLYGASLLLLGTDVLRRVPPVQVDAAASASLDTLLRLSSPVLSAVGATLSAALDPDNLVRGPFWLFLYLAFTVGTAIRLSPSDLEGAASGFLALLAILLVLNGATAWAADPTGPLLRLLAPGIGIFACGMALSLTLSLALALPLWGLSLLLARRDTGRRTG